MPVIIKTSEMQYKDGNGDYHGINAVAEKKVSEQIADLDAAITTRETRIDNDIDDLDAEIDALGSRIDNESTRANGIISQMRTTVNGIENQRQNMISSIASVAGQGTDTTLTQSGVAADAKATGDAVGDLKAAITQIDEQIEIQLNLYNTLTGKSIKSNGAFENDALFNVHEFEVGGLSKVNVIGGDIYAYYTGIPDALTRYDNTRHIKSGNEITIPSTVQFIAVRASATGDVPVAKTQGKLTHAVESLEANEIANAGKIRNTFLQSDSVMVFDTVNSTVTFTNPTYILVDKTRFDYDTADVIVNYGNVVGGNVAITVDTSGNISAYSPSNVPDSVSILFIFQKNKLMIPTTNNIPFSYIVDGMKIEKILRKELYVDGTAGSDTARGGKTSPLKTIQKAVDYKPNVIYVKRGIYNETIAIQNLDNIEIIPDGTPTFSTSVFDVPMIEVNQIVATNCNHIHFRDVHAKAPSSNQGSWVVTNCNDAFFERCMASNGIGGGFVTSNLNGKFVLCTAYDIGDSSHPNSDGFNLHGYGTTELIDCIAYNCVDDGISHHDGCIASIIGGEFYNCSGGGGIAPVNRYCEIDGVYCHDNRTGVEAYQSDATQYDPVILVRNSVMKNNRYKDIWCGDIKLTVLRCSFDTKEIGDGATYTEIN